jgi:putative transposase
MIFNGKYERVGHLWQNRYKNYVVLKDIYLMNLISYVEMNPVRAGLVSLPESYVWSSYRSRVLGKQNMVLDRIENICSNEEAAVGTGLKLNL